MTTAADTIAWDKMGGLLPAIVQDALSGAVLMLGYMNEEALARTRASGLVTFYSRSRERLWVKGETSGNHLRLVDIAVDCDGDALLVLARPTGPVCHTGAETCFADTSRTLLGQLEQRLHERARLPVDQSYTARLRESGVVRVAQKVGEEGVEVALAAATASDADVVGEAADLIYHLLVLLMCRDLRFTDVLAELARRQERDA